MKTQILLVDDEERMLRLLQFVLKPIPASIHCAKRGDAATAIASRLVKVEPENAGWWISLAYSVRRVEGAEEGGSHSTAGAIDTSQGGCDDRLQACLLRER